jgi:hypothetical protein
MRFVLPGDNHPARRGLAIHGRGNHRRAIAHGQSDPAFNSHNLRIAALKSRTLHHRPHGKSIAKPFNDQPLLRCGVGEREFGREDSQGIFRECGERKQTKD